MLPVIHAIKRRTISTDALIAIAVATFLLSLVLAYVEPAAAEASTFLILFACYAFCRAAMDSPSPSARRRGMDKWSRYVRPRASAVRPRIGHLVGALGATLVAVVLFGISIIARRLDHGLSDLLWFSDVFGGAHLSSQ